MQLSLRRTDLSATVPDMTSPAPPRQRLADVLLGRPVLDVIAEARAAGISWPQIRDLIRDSTDGEIDVTWQAIQQWHRTATRTEAGDAA